MEIKLLLYYKPKYKLKYSVVSSVQSLVLMLPDALLIFFQVFHDLDKHVIRGLKRMTSQ